ncbi:MAG: dihydroneopterin aldolase [SAR324 cluster bacterium]|nr:dihydroneopterin aldolase [SAR324 cluster bacterium]
MNQLQETYKINIKGLRLYAYHGVHPEENKLGQEFEIDLLLCVVRPSTKDDRLDQVLSYWDAMSTVKTVFTGKTFKLLENAAQTILDSLAAYPQIKHAEINLKKLTPPIPVTVNFVGVIMENTY